MDRGNSPGESPCHDAGSGGAEQEDARPPTCEGANVLEQIAGLPPIEPVGESLDALARLPDQVGREAGLVAALRHAVKLVADGAQIVHEVALLLRCLLLHLPARLAEQVPGLLFGFCRYLLGL